MNKILPAWVKQNIDRRVVMISGVSLTAALVFWGCLALVKKCRKKKVLELIEEQLKDKKWSDEHRKEIQEKVEMMGSEELKKLIEVIEQNKAVNIEVELDKII